MIGGPIANPVNMKKLRITAATLFILSWVYAGCQQESPKFRQYYVQGETLYRLHCANCHQQDGSGLGRVYPPLHTSDYMDNHFEQVVCLIRYGISGEIMVNGKSYNQAMPAIPHLSDIEIAQITTYIYNTWDHQRGLTDVNEVRAILQQCEETGEDITGTSLP